MEEKDVSVLEEEKILTDDDLGDEEEPKKQTREIDSFYANMRRENEKLKNEKAKLETKLKEERINSVKGFVDSEIMEELGLEGITSEDDIALVESYKNAIKNGDDNPIRTAYNSLYKKSQEAHKLEQEKAQEVSKQEELVAKDKREFEKKFGMTADKALEDKDFMELFGEQISYGNLSALYGKYKNFTSKSKEVDKSKGTMDFKEVGRGVKNSSDPLEGLEGKEYTKAFKKMYSH